MAKLTGWELDTLCEAVCQGTNKPGTFARMVNAVTELKEARLSLEGFRLPHLDQKALKRFTENLADLVRETVDEDMQLVQRNILRILVRVLMANGMVVQ